MRMRTALDGGDNVLLSFVEINPGHFGARRHDRTDTTIGEAEHATNHLLLGRHEHVLAVAVRHQSLHIAIICDGRSRRHPAKQAEYRFGDSLPAWNFHDPAAAVAQSDLIETLNQDRKPNRCVEISLGNMEANTVRYQTQPNHQ